MNKSVAIIIITLVVVGLIGTGYLVTRQSEKEETIVEQSPQLAKKNIFDSVNGQTVGDKIPKTNPFEVKINPFDAYKNPFN